MGYRSLGYWGMGYQGMVFRGMGYRGMGYGIGVWIIGVWGIGELVKGLWGIAQHAIYSPPTPAHNRLCAPHRLYTTSCLRSYVHTQHAMCSATRSHRSCMDAHLQ